jgi:hypothetical protein
MSVFQVGTEDSPRFAQRHEDYSGGLNVALSSHLIADNELQEAVNVSFTEEVVERRLGSIKVNEAVPANVDHIEPMGYGRFLGFASASKELYRYDGEGSWYLIYSTAGSYSTPLRLAQTNYRTVVPGLSNGGSVDCYETKVYSETYQYSQKISSYVPGSSPAEYSTDLEYHDISGQRVIPAGEFYGNYTYTDKDGGVTVSQTFDFDDFAPETIAGFGISTYDRPLALDWDVTWDLDDGTSVGYSSDWRTQSEKYFGVKNSVVLTAAGGSHEVLTSKHFLAANKLQQSMLYMIYKTVFAGVPPDQLPRASAAAVFKSHTMLFGGDCGGKVYFSKPNDHNEWPTNYWVKPGDDEGGAVVNVGILNDKAIFFKDNGIWSLMGDGPTTFAIKRVDPGYALSSPSDDVSRDGSGPTLKNFSEGLIFVDTRGRVIYYDGGEFFDVGRKIQPILDEWCSGTGSSGITWYAAVVGKRYYLTSSTALDDDGLQRVLVYDTIDGTQDRWHEYRYGLSGPITGMCEDPIHQTLHLSSAGSTPTLYRMEVPGVYQDWGTSFTMSMTTKDYDLGSSEAFKKLKNVRVFQGLFNCFARIMPRVDFQEIDVHELEPNTEVERVTKLPLRGKGRYLGFRLASKGPNRSVFRGVTPVWKYKKVK